MIELIHHFLENSARRFPDQCAVVTRDRRFSYGRINADANKLAAWLQSSGLALKDRVLLLMENGYEYITAYYGVLKAGGVVVPINTDVKQQGFSALISDVDPSMLIAGSRFERLLHAMDGDVLLRKKIVISEPRLNWPTSQTDVYPWKEVVSGQGQNNPEITVAPNDLASIVYTSGSSGRPKGVMLSHHNVVSNTKAICNILDIAQNDIQMVVLPFFYAMGSSLLNTHVAVGATVVINNHFAYPADVLRQMVNEKVTSFSGVPSTYAYLLHRSPFANYKEKLPHLRYCSQAGGHMPASLKKKLIEALPAHVKLYIMYGATEATARLTCLEPDMLRRKMNSIGKPIPGVTIKVLDPRGRAVGPFENGEMVAAGPNIMSGYWKDPAATSAALDHNGYHTGDIGYQDDDGYLFLTGRNDRLIKLGGHRVSLLEIEEALLESELIVEAAVIAQKDPLDGFRLGALVTPKKAGDCLTALKEHCATTLSRYKMPSIFKQIHSLPKHANGKTDQESCYRHLFGGDAQGSRF